MSSTQEHHLLPPPSKPKLSPLELRNTDLVSRLLAATPPYLYNMSLLPNTYFFSEMLRSFVHAKNEQRGNAAHGFGGNGVFYGQPMRRSRKRAWSSMSRDNTSQNQLLFEENKPNGNAENESWMIKSMKRNDEAPLELITSPVSTSALKLDENQLPKSTKRDEQSGPFATQQQDSASALVLPPPPPMWYPPIYPTAPYGIDPLHFFIDLRVSGHIYDRKNNTQSRERNAESTVVSPKEGDLEDKKDNNIKTEGESTVLSHRRPNSAFSVPEGIGTKKRSKSPTKFDVKSMGFDKGSNMTSTNYIMGNITEIYKNVAEKKVEEPINVETDESTEEVKQKRAKDLRALLGLELMVDYMSSKNRRMVKSDASSVSEEGDLSSEIESCASPQLEVVALHDED